MEIRNGILGRKKSRSDQERPFNQFQPGSSGHTASQPGETARDRYFSSTFGHPAAHQQGGSDRGGHCSSSSQWGSAFDQPAACGHSAAPRASCQQGNTFRPEAGRGSYDFHSAQQAPSSHQTCQGGHHSARSHHYQPNPQDMPSTSDQYHRSDPNIR